MKRIIFNQDNRVGLFVSKILGRKWIPGEAITIGLEEDGELIAGVLYSDFNGSNVCMHVAAIGKDWLNRAYLWTCFHYAFEQLKVKRITGIVPSINTDALRFDKHLGFIEETRLKDAHPEGDLIILAMYKRHCRYLKGFEYGKGQRTATA